MSVKSRLLALLAMCLCGSTLHSTTVVIVRTPTTIVVAADEMTTFNLSHRHNQRCKILKEKTVYFMAGAFSLEGPIRDSIRHSSSIAEAAQKFADSKLDDWFLRAFTPEQRAKAAKYGHSFGVNQVAFWGIENGVPKYAWVYFFASGPSRLDHDLQVCPGDCRVPKCIGYCDGGFIAPAGSNPAEPDFQLSKLQDSLQQFVAMEEKQHPDAVGGPIDVLTLDAAGAHWNGRLCSALDGTGKAKAHRKKTR